MRFLTHEEAPDVAVAVAVAVGTEGTGGTR